MFYAYLIRCFDEVNNTVMERTGIVYGDTYGDAADKIAKDYGVDNVYRLTIDSIGDGCGNTLETPPEVVKLLVNSDLD